MAQKKTSAGNIENRTLPPNPPDDSSTPPVVGELIHSDGSKHGLEGVEHVETKTTVVNNLPVLLTLDELREKGAQLAKVVSDLAAYVQSRKDAASHWKTLIDGKNTEISRLARVVETRQEHRDVECEIISNYKDGSVTLIRLDTGDQVWERPMDEVERQRALFMPPEGGG